MKRLLIPCLTLLAGVVSSAALADDAYRVVGEVAVQHSGRVMPLDSYARLMVKHVYTRENIKLVDAKDVTTTWTPLPAFLDWQARPDFWNEQEIIAVEYPPLRQKLFDIPAREALQALAKTGKLSATDKARVEAAAKDPKLAFSDLKAAALLNGVPAETAKTLKTFAHKMHPDQKWLSYNDLEDSRIEIDGKETDFRAWMGTVFRRNAAQKDKNKIVQTPLEKKALDVAEKMHIYQSLRDANPNAIPAFDLFITPRPLSPEYLKFTADAYKKVTGGEQHEHSATDNHKPTDLEDDALTTWKTYIDDLKAKVRRIPGQDAEFDAKYTEWLREKSAWIPLRVLQESKGDELKLAGFDPSKIEAVKTAFAAVIASEKADPGKLSTAAAAKLLLATRDLGESTSLGYFLTKNPLDKTWSEFTRSKVENFADARQSIGASSSVSLDQTQKVQLLAAARKLGSTVVPYPPAEEMQRELTFNSFSPFYKAWIVYAVGFVLLLLSIGVSGSSSGSTSKLVERSLYWPGMLAFVSGIGLEILGFYYRVRITGWAPVTNMYETVIWVGLVTAALGLIMELIYRKTYAAAAASGVSLLATLLAANVSLLNPEIQSLNPVLRSNYWLTIHVLTIVSSYAAFALAMGLGMLGIGYYLTATYHRDVPYQTLAKPLIPFLPMLVIGVGGLIAIQPSSMGQSASPQAMLPLSAIAMIGLLGTIVGTFGLIGELCSRSARVAGLMGGVILLAGVGGLFGVRTITTPTWWPDSIGLAAVPAIVGGLGCAMMLLSLMGAASRSVMIEAEARSGSQAMPELPSDHLSPGPKFAQAGGVGIATMLKPSVAEIRARQEASRVVLKPRALAMQATAARIKPLSNFTYRAMQFGVLLVAAGTILGGVWADVSWGRFWGWDAKEVWALVTLLVYLVPLHGRFAGWVNTFTLMAASVFCFASVLMAWYGVNFVLNTGLHSYGFVEGGGQGVVLTASLSVVAIVVATAMRRKLASA